MGCVQYHMDNYGNFKSFNFGLDDDYHTLASQVYSICIRRNSKMCRIAYNAADDGESFYMSQTPTVSKVRSRAGETGCPTDFSRRACESHYKVTAIRIRARIGTNGSHSITAHEFSKSITAQ